MPASLRVKSAAKRWSPEELRDALTPKLMSALPVGVNFKSAKLNRAMVTSPEREAWAKRTSRASRSTWASSP